MPPHVQVPRTGRPRETDRLTSERRGGPGFLSRRVGRGFWSLIGGIQLDTPALGAPECDEREGLIAGLLAHALEEGRDRVR